MEKVEAVYDSEKEVILSKVKVDLSRVDESANLFIGYNVDANGRFKQDYSQKTSSEYTYVPVSSGSYEFYIFEDFDAEDFGLYISPELSKLPSGDIICVIDDVCEGMENAENCPDDCKGVRSG